MLLCVCFQLLMFTTQATTLRLGVSDSREFNGQQLAFVLRSVLFGPRLARTVPAMACRHGPLPGAQLVDSVVPFWIQTKPKRCTACVLLVNQGPYRFFSPTKLRNTPLPSDAMLLLCRFLLIIPLTHVNIPVQNQPSSTCMLPHVA